MLKHGVTSVTDGSGKEHSLSSVPSLSSTLKVDYEAMEQEEHVMLQELLLSLLNSVHTASPYYVLESILSISRRPVNSLMTFYTVEAKVYYERMLGSRKSIKVTYLDTHRSHPEHLHFLDVDSVWTSDPQNRPIYFVTVSKENSLYLVRLAEQIDSMKSQNVHLIIVDYESTDFDVDSLRSMSVVRDIISINGEFSRSGGLDVGIRKVRDLVGGLDKEVLIFAVDSSMLLPIQLPSLIRQNTKRRVCVFTPVCAKFDKYLPDMVNEKGIPLVNDDEEALSFRSGNDLQSSRMNEEEEKHWVHWGYGMIGMDMRDYFDVGGYDTKRWGDR